MFWLKDKTREEKRYINLLVSALQFRWEDDATDSRRRYLHFINWNAAERWYAAVTNGGDSGLTIGAASFRAWYHERPDKTRLPFDEERAVVSRFFNLIARIYVSPSEEASEGLRESSVAHFGAFLNQLIEDSVFAKVILDWVEDADTTNPRFDLSPQPTALLRGVLMSQRLEVKRSRRFWNLAAASEHFPLRVFSDPCSPLEGAFLASWHHRYLARLFAGMSEGAVERFAGHLGREAKTMLVLDYDEKRKRRLVKSVPLDPLIRRNAFEGIVGYLDNGPRRALVERLLNVGAA